MAILTISGRTAVAQALANQPLHFAWGIGKQSWDTTPEPETIGLSALEMEIGRRTVDDVGFCVADPAGEIIVPKGRFRRVATPTNNLLIRVNFSFDDAIAVIREVGVYVGTELKPGLPPGQRYFRPADIVSPGTLLAIERTTQMHLGGALRPSFEFVQTI